MTTHLKRYIERVADVPAQLHRFFSHIRDLDERSADLDARTEDACLRCLEAKRAASAAPPSASPAKRPKAEAKGGASSSAAAAASAGDGGAALEEAVEGQWRHLVSLCEEKVQVANQVSDRERGRESRRGGAG